MKCQKCGAEMVSGHLYCDICGSEYQIVPDFEPEIENSIAQGLSDITETMAEELQENDNKEVLTTRRLKVPSFKVIFLVVVVCSVFVFIGYTKYTHSTGYQNRQALNAVNEGEYYKAVKNMDAPIMPSQLPRIKIDSKGLVKYARDNGKKAIDLTESERKMFIKE